jgi:putative PIN family toxin of toxin-antitoxin system
MIRVVLDTNTVISGILWKGAPHQVLRAAHDGRLKPVSSEILLDELKEVLSRAKFENRLRLIGKTVEQLVAEYAAQCELIDFVPPTQNISKDEDDDLFIACALSGDVKLIVSGDSHLH